jgi:hypothetical protein
MTGRPVGFVTAKLSRSAPGVIALGDADVVVDDNETDVI